MMLFIEHLQDASRSLKSNRMRTLLTALGIMIGVASITAILALSNGIISVISRQVSSLDGNIILVRPGAPVHDSRTIFTTPINQQQFSTSTLTEDDITTITGIKNVKDVVPLMTVSSTLKSDAATLPDKLVVATAPSLETITKLKMSEGQFIDSVTNPNTAVIGAQLAIDLFGTEEPIGQTFTARGQEFTVIGILNRINDPINFNAVDFDNAVIVSLDAGKSFHDGRAQIQQIDVRANTTAALPQVVKQITEQLKAKHGDEQDFTIVSGKDVATPTNQLFITITGIMTVIAAISLIVGGIGIMNIMLVGVAERTREIGLRKAIGASNRNILEQFLTESLLISLTGGILGYITGYLVAFGVSQFLTFNPAFSWQIAVIAFATSIITGVIFGLYPAIRAAHKDPIESLRQYH